MKHIEELISAVTALIGSLISYILSWGTPIEALMLVLLADGALWLIDPLTRCDNIRQAALLPGRKAAIILVVYIAWLLASHMGADVVYSGAAWYYIGLEGISALNHAYNIGLPIPRKLRDILAQLQEDD